jgi:hypothetical protein
VLAQSLLMREPNRCGWGCGCAFDGNDGQYGYLVAQPWSERLEVTIWGGDNDLVVWPAVHPRTGSIIQICAGSKCENGDRSLAGSDGSPDRPVVDTLTGHHGRLHVRAITTTVFLDCDNMARQRRNIHDAAAACGGRGALAEIVVPVLDDSPGFPAGWLTAGRGATT